jgi:glycosyltransferase involved in cell wall biosynthesis
MQLKIILTVYNDWSSLYLVVQKIHDVLKKTEWKDYELIIVNDGSIDRIEEHKDLKARYTLINLLNNQGNQKAVSIGLKYCANENKNFKYLVILDSDGEDKPEDIPRLLKKCDFHNQNKIIFAKRTKRNDGILFNFFYKIYKLIFKILTKHELDFGNFSCIPEKLLKRVVALSSLQTHYSGSIIKANIPIDKIECEKGKRLFGNSTMGLNRKLHHSIMSLSLFIEEIAVKSFFSSLAIMVFIILFSSSVLVLRVFTNFFILGWTSNILLSLFIIFVILLLVALFSIILLILNKDNNRQGFKDDNSMDLIEEVVKKN